MNNIVSSLIPTWAAMAFLTFCIGLVLIMKGSVVRRSIMMRLSNTILGGFAAEIEKGVIPEPAKHAMFRWKIPGYACLLAAVAASFLTRENPVLTMLFMAIAVTLALTGLYVRPNEAHGLHSNLRTQAERLVYLRITIGFSPVMICWISHLQGKDLPVWMAALPVIAVVAERFFFVPKERKYWEDKGVSFEKGTLGTPKQAV